MKPRTNGATPLAELHALLEQALSVHFGRRRRVTRLRRRISRYSSSFIITNLEVELEDQQRLRLVLKDMSPGSILATARAVRPSFLYRPEREIQVYTGLLQRSGLGTPLCYGSVQSEADQRYWLFLERVDGPLLWQTGKMETWEAAARWLALFHSRYHEGRGDIPAATLAAVLRYDDRLLQTWLMRAERFLRSKHGQGCRAQWRRFDRIASSYDLVIERLLRMPATLIHGEFFPSNIIVRRGASPLSICPIDWEVAGMGPGLLDLAALTLGGWKPEQRSRLVAAYHEASQCIDSSRSSMPELTEAVNYCQLHLSIQWLGWAADWSPPEQHARNWLGEASRLAEAVGI
ncbi:MAG TPA: aminoglycoside phosphotransferase family protein [Verrucomicrobiae bacterium]